MRLLYFKLVSWLFADVIQEHLTNCIHPEFGWFWNDGEDGVIYTEQALTQGYQTCLSDLEYQVAHWPYISEGPQEIRTLLQKLLDYDRAQRRLEL